MYVYIYYIYIYVAALYIYIYYVCVLIPILFDICLLHLKVFSYLCFCLWINLFFFDGFTDLLVHLHITDVYMSVHHIQLRCGVASLEMNKLSQQVVSAFCIIIRFTPALPIEHFGHACREGPDREVRRGSGDLTAMAVNRIKQDQTGSQNESSSSGFILEAHSPWEYAEFCLQNYR